MDEKTIQRTLRKYGLGSIRVFYTQTAVRAEAHYMVGSPQQLARLREAGGDHNAAQQLSGLSFKADTADAALAGLLRLLENEVAA